MNIGRFRGSVLAVLVLCSYVHATAASEIRVAVASNFAPAMTAIVTKFSLRTGQQVVIVPGSTGKHFAQISNGAPFDVFFAADARRPARLAKEGIGIQGSLYTYALGRLALWSRSADSVANSSDALSKADFRFLAIANPALAPYGQAAKETLKTLGRWEDLQDKLVRGENIAQTFQFVYSGNAELGLVARAQLVSLNVRAAGDDLAGLPVNGSLEFGSYWIVPETLHAPIRQQAIQLVESEAVSQFMAFMHSAEVQQIILAYGYDLPDDEQPCETDGSTDCAEP
jgi:molybdate transport system substrate-binding protein